MRFFSFEKMKRSNVDEEAITRKFMECIKEEEDGDGGKGKPGDERCFGR